MAIDYAVKMLETLIATRKAAIDIDDRWNGYTDVEREAAFKYLETVQDDLLKSDFGCPKAMACAFEMLLDGDDDPNFGDEFKNRLFEILRRSRTT